MDSITPCARTMPGPFCGTGSSSTSRASATRSMTTARRDTASVEVTHCHGLTRHASALYRRGYTTDEGEAWLHEIKHDPSGLSPEMEERPTLRPAGVLLFARFRWWEQPESLRGTIEHALFLPSGRPNLWGTPDNPRLPGVRAVWLNTIRDVTFQAIGSDSAILSYRDRSKHRSGRDNS